AMFGVQERRHDGTATRIDTAQQFATTSVHEVEIALKVSRCHHVAAGQTGCCQLAIAKRLLGPDRLAILDIETTNHTAITYQVKLCLIGGHAHMAGQATRPERFTTGRNIETSSTSLVADTAKQWALYLRCTHHVADALEVCAALCSAHGTLPLHSAGGHI